MQPANSDAADRAAILAHVRSIFEAYVRGDLAAIESTHTSDWRGFTIQSDKIVRGREGYMKNARATTDAVDTLDFELLDTELEIHGDTALLWYVARDVIRPKGGEPTTLYLRALDVYRRTPDGWNQCGSNVCKLPNDASWSRDAD